MSEILETSFNGTLASDAVQLDESVLARIDRSRETPEGAHA